MNRFRQIGLKFYYPDRFWKKFAALVQRSPSPLSFPLAHLIDCRIQDRFSHPIHDDTSILISTIIAHFDDPRVEASDDFDQVVLGGHDFQDILVDVGHFVRAG